MRIMLLVLLMLTVSAPRETVKAREEVYLQVLFVIVMVICTISSFVGIRKAFKVEPAEALGG